MHLRIQAVVDDDVVVALEELVYEVGADKPGAAGDEDLYLERLPGVVSTARMRDSSARGDWAVARRFGTKKIVREEP